MSDWTPAVYSTRTIRHTDSDVKHPKPTLAFMSQLLPPLNKKSNYNKPLDMQMLNAHVPQSTDKKKQ